MTNEEAPATHESASWTQKDAVPRHHDGGGTVKFVLSRCNGDPKESVQKLHNSVATTNQPAALDAAFVPRLVGEDFEVPEKAGREESSADKDRGGRAWEDTSSHDGVGGGVATVKEEEETKPGPFAEKTIEPTSKFEKIVQPAPDAIFPKAANNQIEGMFGELIAYKNKCISNSDEEASARTRFELLSRKIDGRLQKLDNFTGTAEEKVIELEVIKTYQIQMETAYKNYRDVRSHNVQLLDGMANVIKSLAELMVASRNDETAAIKNFQKMNEAYEAVTHRVDAVLDTHVRVTLFVWIFTMVARYWKLIFFDFSAMTFATTGLVGVGTWVGGSYILSMTGALAGSTIFQMLREVLMMHSSFLVGCTTFLVILSEKLLGLRRIWMLGSWIVCVLLLAYIFVFERYISPTLRSNILSMTKTSRMLLQWIGAFIIGLVVVCPPLFIYHLSEHCILPHLTKSRNVRYSQGCQPLMKLVPGEACEIECKDGYENPYHLPPFCKGWIYDSCATTTYECTLDGVGHYLQEADLWCFEPPSDMQWNE